MFALMAPPDIRLAAPFDPAWGRFELANRPSPLPGLCRFHGCRCVRGGPDAVHAKGTTLAPETFPVARPTVVADEVRIVVPRLASSQWL